MLKLVIFIVLLLFLKMNMLNLDPFYSLHILLFDNKKYLFL